MNFMVYFGKTGALRFVQVMYHAENCRHCKKCISICPEKAIIEAQRGRICVDVAKCTGCLACVNECPGRALTQEGESKTVREVYDICLQDLDFYEESGGGVTISGGEGMVWPDFVEELVLMLKARGIHTAIETTGCVSSAVFQRLAPLFDLLLFEVKQYDSDLHKKGCGVGNEQILENLRWAYSHNLNILPRIPVIPGFNDEISDAEGPADLLCEIGLAKVQLLPFHQMGERKYEFLGRDYGMAGVGALHPEDLGEYRRVFLDRGMECVI